MEDAGLVSIFSRFLHTSGICYKKYIGDGNSKGYQIVTGEKPYDPKIRATKLGS
jgi:hypothetical protein